METRTQATIARLLGWLYTPRMAKHVIIFGAGASVPFGAPVMADFLDKAEALFAANNVGDAKDSFENVFRAISKLQAVHSKSEFDLINLESVFTAFELAKLLGRFPEYVPDQLNTLISDLKRVIVVTLEKTMSFQVDAGGPQPPRPLWDFVHAIWGRDTQQHSVAILTFNYDLAFDLTCAVGGFPVDYGLRTERQDRAVPLLKLHGSLNWGVSEPDGKILPLNMEMYLRRTSSARGGHVTLAVGSDLKNVFQHVHSARVQDLPLLVPPSWNKADSHRAISAVWARAARELSEADSIFVVGYSLPVTDTFFRQLYALGTVGSVPLKRFWVLNPDRTRDAVFQGLLGPGARARYRFFEMGLQGALSTIADALR